MADRGVHVQFHRQSIGGDRRLRAEHQQRGGLAFGTAAGFIASLVVGGGGFLRHAVVGLLGMLVVQGIVRVTGWRASTGYRFLDSMAMAVIGAILVVLLARFIA